MRVFAHISIAVLSLSNVLVASALSIRPSGTTIDVEGAVRQEKKCCGHAGKDCPGHFPDIPARVFYNPGARAVSMIVGSTAYFPMHGPTPLNQTRSCTISYNKTADPNPSHYAANEYLDSPYSFGNGTVVSLTLHITLHITLKITLKHNPKHNPKT